METHAKRLLTWWWCSLVETLQPSSSDRCVVRASQTLCLAVLFQRGIQLFQCFLNWLSIAQIAERGACLCILLILHLFNCICNIHVIWDKEMPLYFNTGLVS